MIRHQTDVQRAAALALRIARQRLEDERMMRDIMQAARPKPWEYRPQEQRRRRK